MASLLKNVDKPVKNPGNKWGIRRYKFCEEEKSTIRLAAGNAAKFTGA